MIQFEESDMIKKIHDFWTKELKQFQNNNSQEKTFWKIFCKEINLDSNEAIKWLEGGFSPGEAKEWMDKNFSLEQAKKWRNNGVLSPEGAEYWKNQNYIPDDVGIKISQIYSEEIDIWIKAGFSPGEAKRWIAAKFRSPKEAAAWIFAGFLSPTEAAMLRGRYGSPLKALETLKENWEIFNNSNNPPNNHPNFPSP